MPVPDLEPLTLVEIGAWGKNRCENAPGSCRPLFRCEANSSPP